MIHSQPASERYQERIDRFSVEHGEFQRRWSLLANVRLALFLVMAVLLWQWVAANAAIFGFGALAVGVALLPTLVAHRRLRSRRDDLAGMIAINEHARDRATLAWSSDIPRPPIPAPDHEHPYARDLNVIGEASLLRRVGTPATVAGWRALQHWLLVPADIATIRERQAAVSELGDQVDLRQRVERARLSGSLDPESLDEMLRWAESERLLPRTPWIVALAGAGPVALAAAILAQWAGWTTWPLWTFALAFNLIVSQVIGGALVGEVSRVGSVANALDGYRSIVAQLSGSRASSSLLRRIHDSLFGASDGAATRIQQLARVMSFIMPRGSLLYAPLQMAFAWDIHIAAALDRWKAASGRDLRHCLDEIGEWEAIAALSVLRWDHQDWAMPEVQVEKTQVVGTLLQHPLLSDDIAVGNDVTVGPAGTFLFVTGSNMSGKSTLLRAVGANVVLAQAGAPVAAVSMSLPPVEIATTMRVEDSLAHGVSFFLAELQRLKQVVDAADAATERPVLYLLDEILQGTNTAERQIASRRVLHHLTTTSAIGAVSSHDLTLIGESSLEASAAPVHFSEQFDEQEGVAGMTFDYQLRPGLATSSNALALMELLGFPEDVDDS
ncbi:MAG: hypothetical protein H0V98_08070 [Chloroflexia bacterium]|nr:hypothetical protein [Chloroflexia bacterium]